MTNSNSNEFDEVKNFTPIPKRFMVRDDKAHSFVKGVNGYILTWREIANLVEPSVWDCACEMDEIVERFTIVQSTNLFDKDGKEIFEGSIVEDEYNGQLGYVYYEPKVRAWRIRSNNENEEDDGWALECSEDVLKTISHILSNPELLEEKNV